MGMLMQSEPQGRFLLVTLTAEMPCRHGFCMSFLEIAAEKHVYKILISRLAAMP